MSQDFGMINTKFESPNICRDIQNTPEFITLKNAIRDDFGHKIVNAKKHLSENKEILTGFRVSPLYKNMLLLFCPDIISSPIRIGEGIKIYGLPVTEDEEVSCMHFEYKNECMV